MGRKIDTKTGDAETSSTKSLILNLGSFLIYEYVFGIKKIGTNQKIAKTYLVELEI